MLPLDKERSIKEPKYKGVFDVRLSQGKIEHTTFFFKVSLIIAKPNFLVF